MNLVSLATKVKKYATFQKIPHLMVYEDGIGASAGVIPNGYKPI